MKAVVEIIDQLKVAKTVPVGVCFPAIVIDGKTMSAANVSKKWIDFDAEKLFEKALGPRHPVRQRRGRRRARRGSLRRSEGRRGPRDHDDARHRHRQRDHLQRRAGAERRARAHRDRRQGCREPGVVLRQGARRPELGGVGEAPAEVLQHPRVSASPPTCSWSAAASRRATRSSCRCSTCARRSFRRRCATTPGILGAGSLAVEKVAAKK